MPRVSKTLEISVNTLYTWVSRDKNKRENGLNKCESRSSVERIKLLKEVSELKKQIVECTVG